MIGKRRSFEQHIFFCSKNDVLCMELSQSDRYVSGNVYEVLISFACNLLTRRVTKVQKTSRYDL